MVQYLTSAPPLAVAPLPNVRKVVEYALTRISRSKLFLGIPTYGYDWTLPYQRGNPGAPSVSPVDAVALASKYGAVINYDEFAQSPWFNYTDDQGRLHEVWFEDAKSAAATMALIDEFSLRGFFTWNIMRFFPSLWLVANSSFGLKRYYE